MELENELNKAENEARKNLNEDTTKVPLTMAELEGLPDDIKKGLAKVPDHDDQRYVSMKKNEIEPAMSKIKSSEARRKLAEAKESV